MLSGDRSSGNALECYVFTCNLGGQFRIGVKTQLGPHKNIGIYGYKSHGKTPTTSSTGKMCPVFKKMVFSVFGRQFDMGTEDG